MMLEVKNLKKVYKIKNANPVPALDDVSLKFPDTGLVFILGKSGSGKSTLLNVMGGLDVADSGEIVINGKSSKNFDASEMDSYRNTYLGFIFQEYNILSDFTVRENIALALELQHKKPTDEIINSILEEVDLVGFGKRKPNELSGGQKQRVAIARALVKEPKILFGDEPTGALDSATGLAVFETLKKLSKTRLVVIVSHDRDFAERFGDRVIELKDGKVISDITKITEDTDETESGVSLYGSNLIRFEKGHKLTKEDIDLINKKLATTDEDAYFSIDSRINDSVSYAAMINENGQKESFIETDNECIEQKKEKWRVVKSKFPMSAAFRMGAKSLRVKPFRLFMTILLSFVAFAMFGLAVTFARVNKVSATVNSLEKSDEQVIVFTKGGWGGDNKFGEAFKQEVEARTGVGFDVVGRFDAGLYNSTVKNVTNNYYYSSQFYGCVALNADKAQKYGVKLHRGTYPTGLNEICISLDTYNTFKGYGIRDAKEYTKYIEAESVTEDNILGFYIRDNSNNYYKIVGIIDTNLDLSPYDSLKKADPSSMSQELYDLSNKLQSARQTGLHCMAFVSLEYFEKNVIGKSNNYSFNDEWGGAGWFGLEYEQDGADRKDNVVLFTDETKKTFFNQAKTDLGKNEILVDMDYLARIVSFLKIYEQEEGIDEWKEYTFDGIYSDVTSDGVLITPYSANISWQQAYNMVYDDISFRYGNDLSGLTNCIYAQNYFNSYKALNGEKVDPYVANQLFNYYREREIWNSRPEGDITKQLFKTVSESPLEFDTIEINGENYYQIDFAKVPAFITSGEPDAQYFYMNVYYNLKNHIQNWTSNEGNYDNVFDNTDIKDDVAAYAEQAKQLLITKIINQCPNAKALQNIQRFAEYSYNKYTELHYEEFYNDYKDNEILINAFKEYRREETLVFDDNLKREFMNWYMMQFVDNYGNYDVSEYDNTWYLKYKQARIDRFNKAIVDGNLSLSDMDITFSYITTKGNSQKEKQEYAKKIVGVFIRESSSSIYTNYIFYMQRSEIEEFAASKMDLNYSRMFAAKPSNTQALTKIVSLYYDSQDAYDKIDWKDKTNDDFYYALQSPLVNSIMIWVSLLSELEKIFLYVGIAMAAFSMLLFYNFMSISINNKRHEIGILRAVGARGVDVFKIFYSESAIIAVINFVLAIAALIAVAIVLNNKIGEAIAGLVLLKVGFVEILMVFAVALVASVISSLLPVARIARQKPIDAIREK